METRKLTPEARKYEVQRINGLPEQEAHPTDPAIVARIDRENRMIVEARKRDTPRKDNIIPAAAMDRPPPKC